MEIKGKGEEKECGEWRWSQEEVNTKGYRMVVSETQRRGKLWG